MGKGSEVLYFLLAILVIVMILVVAIDARQDRNDIPVEWVKYTVRTGDTWWDLVDVHADKRYWIDETKEFNNMGDIIKTGQIVYLPRER